MAPRQLELQRLSVGALEAVTLTVAPGEVVCVSGASGSGKTRMLRAIADLEPHEGEVWLGGERQQETPAHLWRQRVTLVPAESQWWADHVGAHFSQEMGRELSRLGFGPQTMDWAVSRLSSGEKQRLALVRALCHGPSALLLDEPTANLDPELTETVEQWLLELARTRQLPLLWVAHDPRQIARVANRHYHIRGSALEPA